MNISRSTVLAAAAIISACSNSPSKVYSPSSGSLALSRDDRYLYAVDGDNNFVAVVETASMNVVAKVAVGASPERITVAPDDTLYVTNRGDRSVSVIQRGQWQEAARIPVGIEPVGVVVSPDNKVLYVVNATSLQDPSTGTLMAIDAKSHSLNWEIAVGEEPRGLGLLANGNAVISLYKQGEMVTVDPKGPSIIPAATGLSAAANTANVANSGTQNVPAGSPGQPALETFHARGMGSLTVAPDGKTVYAPLMWSSNAIIPLSSSVISTVSSGGGCGGGPAGLPPNPGSGGSGGGGGAGYGGGGCGGFIAPNAPQGTVVLPGLATFDGVTGTPKVDNVTTRTFALQADFPATILHTGSPAMSQAFPGGGKSATFADIVQEPVAVAVDATGSFLFVVNRASNNVAILPTTRSQQPSQPQQGGPFATPPSSTFDQPYQALVPVGLGANGIALTQDGTRAFVYNAFDHSITTIVGAGASPVALAPVTIAGDTLNRDQVAGREIFFSAQNSSVTSPQVGISCSSCHLEGREDGHVWHFTDGPRQTPALVGRMLDKTAPYHWAGVLPSIHDFMDMTITQRMGGTGLTTDDEARVASYLVAASPPDNPFRGAALNASQLRGAQLFQSAQCSTCHSGEALTNNAFASVGTQSNDGRNPDDFSNMPNGLNVPSLLGVGRSAPYLHDGSMATLQDRITMNQANNQHGQTSSLSGQDVEDLVAFLKTL